MLNRHFYAEPHQGWYAVKEDTEGGWRVCVDRLVNYTDADELAARLNDLTYATPFDQETADCEALEAETARDAGWTETPDGEWWRAPFPGEIASEAGWLDGTFRMFLGSGPFVFVASAQAACERDGL